MNSYQKFSVRCRVLAACFRSLASRAGSAKNYGVAYRAELNAAQAAFPTYATEATLRATYRELAAKL